MYFWDVLAAILAVIIYSALFKMIHRKLGLLGKILNFRDRPQTPLNGKSFESARRTKRTPVHAYINQRLRTISSKNSTRAQQSAREPHPPTRKN